MPCSSADRSLSKPPGLTRPRGRFRRTRSCQRLHGSSVFGSASYQARRRSPRSATSAPSSDACSTRSVARTPSGRASGSSSTTPITSRSRPSRYSGSRASSAICARHAHQAKPMAATATGRSRGNRDAAMPAIAINASSASGGSDGQACTASTPASSAIASRGVIASGDRLSGFWSMVGKSFAYCGIFSASLTFCSHR